jgi:hypothetical protein
MISRQQDAVVSLFKALLNDEKRNTIRFKHIFRNYNARYIQIFEYVYVLLHLSLVGILLLKLMAGKTEWESGGFFSGLHDRLVTTPEGKAK